MPSKVQHIVNIKKYVLVEWKGKASQAEEIECQNPGGMKWHEYSGNNNKRPSLITNHMVSKLLVYHIYGFSQKPFSIGIIIPILYMKSKFK